MASEPPNKLKRGTVELDQLSAESLGLVRALGALATHKGIGLYLVGGSVRDLFLRVPNTDLDFAVEGDALRFARDVSDAWTGLFPGKPSVRDLVVSERFGTSKLVISETETLDFASTREELYATPGHPPQVTFPTRLEADLARRDFSVNAVALDISPQGWGRIIDPHEGMRDLNLGVLRILHEKSFLDDPMRLVRGVCFAVRFGFTFDADTERLFHDAVTKHVIPHVSPSRRFDELRKALIEADPAGVVSRLAELQVLEQLVPGTRRVQEILPALNQTANWLDRVALLLSCVTREEAEAYLKTSGIPRKLRSDILREMTSRGS